ncbi:MAG: hypothetical protein U0W40_19255 [Acidimicrobiia bacterium]
MLGSAHRLGDIEWYWLITVARRQGVVLLCTWELQRLLIIGRAPRASASWPPAGPGGLGRGHAAPLGGAASYQCASSRSAAPTQRGERPRRLLLLQVASVGALLVGPLMALLGIGGTADPP